MGKFKIPDYCNIFPKPEVHPQYELVKRQSLDMALSFLGEDGKALKKSDFALFWSMFAPSDVPAWRLEVAVQWYQWVS
jgi:hypothetical protein